MDRSTPPNAHTGHRDAMSSFSSSTPKITSASNLRTPLAHEPLSPMIPHTPSHTAAVRQSTGSETAEPNDNTMAGSSNPAASDAPSLLKYGPIPEPKLPCGLLRNLPAALSANSQQTYYSERSYPTPVAPPPPGIIDVQIAEIRRCRAALPTETETVAQRRHMRANERVFRVKNERTYRIPDPRFKNVVEAEVPLPIETQSTPRFKLESSPLASSPVTVVGTEAVEDELSPPSFSSDGSQSTEVPFRNSRRVIPDSEDEEIKSESSDVAMLEVDEEVEAAERMDISDEDEDETLEGTSQTLASDEEIKREQASDLEVMSSDETIDAETETQHSTEFESDDTLSEDDNESDYSDFSDTFQPKHKTKSKSKAVKSKAVKSKPEPISNTKRNPVSSSNFNFPIQNQSEIKVYIPIPYFKGPDIRSYCGANEVGLQPVSSITFPRLPTGVNQNGYSRMLLSIPRVVKKQS